MDCYQIKLIFYGPTPASFWLIFVFSNKHRYNFYNKYMWKIFDPVYCAGIRTHDLQEMSLLSLPLDQGSRPDKLNLYKQKNST